MKKSEQRIRIAISLLTILSCLACVFYVTLQELESEIVGAKTLTLFGATVIMLIGILPSSLGLLLGSWIFWFVEQTQNSLIFREQKNLSWALCTVPIAIAFTSCSYVVFCILIFALPEGIIWNWDK